MKKLICAFWMAVALGPGAVAAPPPEFIHATYSVSGLLSEAELSNPCYDRFQFIYVMGSPAWWTVNFDRPQEAILRDADAFDYSSLEGGIALTPEMIRQAHAAGTKILLCFGGTEQFRPMLERPERFASLADYMVRVVQNNGFDGIDIDWESTVVPEQHAEFLRLLRERLDALAGRSGRTYYLTTALGADVEYDDISAGKLGAAVDWINVMTYDMSAGIWGDCPEHNTSMPDLQYYLSRWDRFGRNKICAGLASYGFIYRGVHPGEKAEQPLNECGAYITYNEFLGKLAEGWTESYDLDADVSYYFSPDGADFVTIENPVSIRKKIEWIVRNGYRGAFWWEFHYDYRTPGADCPNGSHALIDVVTAYLNMNQPTQTDE